MKSLILTTMLSTLLSHGANTSTAPLVKVRPPVPASCPSLNSLITQGLDYVAPMFIAWVGVKENSYYDTKDNWTLVMFDPTNETKGRVAMQQLVKDLKIAQNQMGPTWDNDLQAYGCTYQDKDNNLFVAAITPSIYSE